MSASMSWPSSPRAGYGDARQWLRAQRGKATAYLCTECDAPAHVWSYDGGDPQERTTPQGYRYSLDPAQYRPCCRTCARLGPATELTRQARRARQCEVPGCGRRHVGHGYCSTHRARVERLGDACPEIPVEERQLGGVSYWSVHHRLGVERGPAAGHGCADCGRRAASWSYDGTDPQERASVQGYRYSLDLYRYRPLCQSCHRRATAARTPPRPGSRVPDVDEAVWLYQRGVSGPGIAALMEVSHTAVYAALRARGVPIRPRGTRRPLGQQQEDTSQP